MVVSLPECRIKSWFTYC